MKCILFIRNIEDWQSASFSGLTHHDDNNIPVDAMQLWDKTFTLKYFEFRVKLQEIALDNWSCLSVESHKEELGEVEDDDWLIAVDDDDWFHPDLTEILESVPIDVDVVHWDCLVHQMIQTPTLSQWYDHHDGFGTNNYAIRGRWAKDKARLMEALVFHERAANLFKDTKVQKLERTLSCYNRHFGGISTLWFCKRTSARLMTFNPTERVVVPNEHSWLRPYSTRMCDLLEGLRPKRQIGML